MGGRKAEAVATKTTTERALQAARQTTLNRDDPEIAELDPGRGNRQAATDQLEQEEEDDLDEEEWKAMATAWENVTAL